MLSYRHGYHAGNFADVLKHLVQVRILRHLTVKAKPLCYLDTHAGAGGYALDDAKAQRTGEFRNGIGRLWTRSDLPEVVADYRDLVAAFNEGEALSHYPGSPWFAAELLRDQDRLLLHELHNTEIDLLRQGFGRDRRVRVNHSDGFQGCVAALPPQERRGLVMIDPPYELKTDYQAIVATLQKAHRRFATGVYAIWYPVVERARIDALEKALVASGIPSIQLFELGLQADTQGHGMTASGMLVVNPPWRLMAEISAVLPWLAETLGEPGQGRWRALELVGE